MKSFTKATTDQQLIAEVSAGNEQALETLIVKYKDRVYTSIYYLVKDRYLAEDLFQDTMIKAINKIRKGQYAEEGKLRPWLLRIAHNLCIDYFRKIKRKPPVVDSEGIDIFSRIDNASDNREDTLIQNEDHLQVRKLLNQLPNEQREVVVLRHYYEFSFKEIAKMTSVSINTALGRMRYALINLRKMMEEENEKDANYIATQLKTEALYASSKNLQ